MVQDFVARLRNPTLVVLEWTPPQRPGIIKYRVRLLHCCASGNCSKRKALIIVDVIILFLFTVAIIHYYAGHIQQKACKHRSGVCPSVSVPCVSVPSDIGIYRVAQNKIPHRRICNISTTSGLILKILEAA